MSDITLNSLGSGKNNLVITFTDSDPIDTVEYVIFIVDSSNSIVATQSFSLEDAQSVTSNGDGSNTIVYEYADGLINGQTYSVQFGKNKDSELVLQPQLTTMTIKVYDVPNAPVPIVDHSGCKITVHWDKVSANGSAVTSYNIYKAELNESSLVLNGDWELERLDVSGNVLVPYDCEATDLYVKVGSSYVKSAFGNLRKIDTIDYIKESIAVGSNILYTESGLTDMLGNPISNINGELYDMDGVAILDFSGNMISIEDDTDYVIAANGNQVLADSAQNAIVYPDGKYSYSVSGDTSGQFVPQKYGLYNQIHSVNYVQADQDGLRIYGTQDGVEPTQNMLVIDTSDFNYPGVVSKMGKLVDLSGNQVYDLSGNALEAVNDSIKRDSAGQPVLTLLANCPLVGGVYQGLIANYMGATTQLGYQHIKHQGDKNIGFLVTAVNGAGESPVMGEVVMPYADNDTGHAGQIVYAGPDAPTNLESALSNVDGSGVVLSWVVPSSNGQLLDGYLLVLSDMSGNQVYGTVDLSVVTGSDYALMKALMKPAGSTVSMTLGFDTSAGLGSLASYFNNPPLLIKGTPITLSTIKNINFSNIKNYSFQLIAVNQNVNDSTAWNPGYGPLFKDISNFSNSTAIMPQSKPVAVRTFTSVPGDKKLTLSWVDDLQNALTQPILGYVITYTIGGQSKIVSATGSSKVITGLVNGTAYTFQIMARNAKGLSLPTALYVESASNVPVGPPIAPILYLDGHDLHSVALAWTRPSNAGGSSITGYNIYRSHDGKQTWQRLVNAGGALATTVGPNVYYYNDTSVDGSGSFVAPGTLNQQPYYYKVTAVNINGESDPSNIVDEYPSTTPGAPSLSITVGKEKVTLVMRPDTSGGLINNGGDPLLSYTIYRGIAGSFDFITGTPNMVTPAIDGSGNPLMPYATDIPLDGSGNAIFVDTNVVNGNMYVYRVMAVNRDGPGASNKLPTYSGIYVYNDGSRNYAVPCDVPEVINSLVARSPYNNSPTAASEIDLVFTPPVNNGAPVTSYQLQYSNDNSNWYTYINFSGSYTNLLVANNTAPLLATDASGGFLNTGLLTVGDNMLLNTEYQVDGSGHVQSVSDASGSIRFSVKVDGSGNNLYGVPENYEMGHEYFFRVISRNLLGYATDYSNVVSATPSRQPSAPTELTIAPGNESVVLGWSAPVNNGGSPILYYEIYDGDDVLVTRVTALTCTITGLTNGTSYTFKVKAFNKNGPNATAANFSSVTPFLVTNPPRNLQYVSQDQRLTIRWDAPNNVTEETVLSYTYSMITPVGTVITSATVLASDPRTVTINNLTNGAQYIFRIYAHSLGGNSDSVTLDTRVDANFTPSTVAFKVNPLNGARNGNLVTLTWATPVNNGGSPITSYLIVYYDTLGNTFYRTLDASETSFQITSVPQIHAAIFAVNANGVSPMSNVVIV